MITKEEILRLAYERGACKDGLEWYSKIPKKALLTWDALTEGYFGWVALNIPEAIPYLRTLPEELKERALNADEFYIRTSMAIIGYRLEVLKDDPVELVRLRVAKQGYALEQLKDDYVEYVRQEVARQGYALEQLKDDPKWEVRWEVARQGYALEQLKDDPYYEVRAEVALKGYALEQLKDDLDEYVKYVARKKLKEMQQ